MSNLPEDQITPDLLRFVWRYSGIDQLLILAITLVGMPLLYLSLELPKIIVNDAIQGAGFPRVIGGQALGQSQYLLALCALFFATVMAINGVKWLTNMAVGMTGERLLRRLRFAFFAQTMRFPPRRMANARPGEVVQAVMAEIEPIGGFLGEILATPASQGGMLAVMLGFIFVQNPLLGLAASAMLPVQAIVIPLLQRRVIRLNRRRALNNRRVADTLVSAVAGMADIRAHGLQRWHLATMSGLLHTNTEIRKAIFRRKFTIKLVNNLLNQLTPFLFFAIGGMMVIRGQLDLGALVAVITAYKDIGKPWRELLSYYQRLSDFRARFRHVAECFSGFDLMPASRIETAPKTINGGTLAMHDVEIYEAGDLLRAPCFEISPGQTVALIGGSREARGALTRAAAGLEPPIRGVVTLGGVALSTLCPADIGTIVGGIDGDPLIVAGSVRRNIEYALYRAAPALPAGGTDRFRWREARRTGMPLHDPDGDWVDATGAGCADRAALDRRVMALVEDAGMADDLALAALGTPLATIVDDTKRDAIDRARASVIEAVYSGGLEDIVERPSAGAFAENLTVLENLLFAMPERPDSSSESLLGATPVTNALSRVGALDFLAEIGADVAVALAAIANTVSPDSPLLDRVGSYSRADILSAAALAQVVGNPSGRAGRDRRAALVALAARYTPVRDRLDALDDARIARLMALRGRILDGAAPAGFVRFDAGTAPGAMTIGEHLLGGRRRENRRAGWRRLDAALLVATDEAGLRDLLVDVGLDQPLEVPVNPPTRLRVSLLRAALKRPHIVFAHANGLAEGASLSRFLRGALPHAMIMLSVDGVDWPDDVDFVARLDEDGTLAVSSGRTA